MDTYPLRKINLMQDEEEGTSNPENMTTKIRGHERGTRQSHHGTRVTNLFAKVSDWLHESFQVHKNFVL